MLIHTEGPASSKIVAFLSGGSHKNQYPGRPFPCYAGSRVTVDEA